MLVTPQERMSTCRRGQQQLNNTKSVSASPSQSKAAHERQTRKDSYREKFSNRPHMIIPQEDSAFIRTQSRATMILWHECWEQDPFGNRWMTLNHSLKSTSFWEAKKVLSERGLFAFKRETSIRDGRETVCWLVINLHGARRNDYWLKSTNLESAPANSQSAKPKEKSATAKVEFAVANPISIETQTEQGLQNSSGGVSGSSSVTPQRVTEEPGATSEVGDRHHQPAFEERVGLAPPPKEKKKAETSSLVTKSQNEISRENLNPVKDLPAPPEKNILLSSLEEDYVYDWRSGASIDRAKAQNLAIEAEQKTKEYQSTSKDALDRIRANLSKQQERKKLERKIESCEDNPMSLTDWQNLQEFVGESRAKESPNAKIINRPDPEDYPDDW